MLTRLSFLVPVAEILDTLLSALDAIISAIGLIPTSLIGISLPIVASIWIYRTRSKLRNLMALKAELLENKRTASNILPRIAHDARTGLEGEERYSWPTQTFSISAYEQMRNDGTLEQLPHDLRTRISDHYDELNELNAFLSQREQEKIAPTNPAEVNPSNIAGGLAFDMSIICSDEHISQMETDSEHVAWLLKFLPFGVPNNNAKHLKETCNFDTVYSTVEDDIKSHNYLAKQIFT